MLANFTCEQLWNSRAPDEKKYEELDGICPTYNASPHWYCWLLCWPGLSAINGGSMPPEVSFHSNSYA